jgi:hypothetical protein
VRVTRLSDNIPSLSDTDRTCSKDSVQGTKGLVWVSESPRVGVWGGRCSEWGTADTSGVVDRQANGGGRTVVAPIGEQGVRRCYRGFGIVHEFADTCNKITLTSEHGGDYYRLCGQVQGKEGESV